MDVLTWYLRCFVGILIQGGEVQKDAKLGFSSQQHGGLVVLVMSVDNWYMIYVFLLFINECATIVFSHIQDLEGTCVRANLALLLTLHALCPFGLFMGN